MSTTFDLDDHDPRPRADEGVDMPLLDPAGNATGVSLRVRGFDSQAYRDVLDEQLRRRTAMLPRKPTPEESKTEFYEEHAALICGWSGLQRAKKPYEYSPANAVQLLQAYAYILEQVRRFAGDRRNFLPGSAKI
jgi:hypothetical protein